jgi:hypothetical protein
MQDNRSRNNGKIRCRSRICETENSYTKNQGSKRNHEQHLWRGWTGSSIGSGVIHAGYARPGIDGPRRFDRRAGGGIIIWIYEALVWVGVQHLMPLAGIPRNATGLVFGKQVQEQLGTAAYFVGTGIHFLFALAWGVVFAYLWPIFRRRGYEATLVALFYAVVIWIVMHAAIMVATTSHPDYFDPMVVIGGFMSHFFYAVPLALIVKRRLAATG